MQQGAAQFCRAKAGGSDPEANASLQQVIEQARKANVPKDIIERNLKRASDKDSANLTDEVRCKYAHTCVCTTQWTVCVNYCFIETY